MGTLMGAVADDRRDRKYDFEDAMTLSNAIMAAGRNFEELTGADLMTAMSEGFVMGVNQRAKVMGYLMASTDNSILEILRTGGEPIEDQPAGTGSIPDHGPLTGGPNI